MAARFAKASNPIKTQKTMKTPSTIDFPVIQPSSALSTHFIDLTRLGTKKDSDN